MLIDYYQALPRAGGLLSSPSTMNRGYFLVQLFRTSWLHEQTKMSQLLTKKGRIQSIDMLRGIVMIIMAIDHVRDFFHQPAFTEDPLDPATTTAALYFTRWITHFCAPVFVFLAGTAAYLQGLKKTRGDLSKFLITRGLWLVVAELVIISFGWTFDPGYHNIPLQVIWAIGICMMALGLLVWLPLKAILAIGVLIFAGHNLLDYYEALLAGRNQPPGFWLDVIHSARFTTYEWMPGHNVFVVYPVLAWIGIMALGYCAGRWFEPTVDAARRKKILLWTGSGLIVLFIVVRAINAYGDPNRWKDYPTLLQDFFSFMNVTKYPPSLLYSSITLGPALIALAALEGVQNKLTDFARVYGRVPFFFYILHFYLIHTLAVLAFFFIDERGVDEIVDPNSFMYFRPLDFGYGLPVVYGVWIYVVLALYPLCKWYDRYKSTHKKWWLSYL